MSVFNPLKKYSRTNQIVEEIRNAVNNGDLHTGDRLPPERELAERFGVSRTSIREAVKILSTYGLVRSVQGDGLYVTDQFSENMFDYLGYGSYITRGNYRMIYQARQVMETGALLGSLSRFPPAELDRMDALIAETEREDDVTRLQCIDADFHITMIEASNNPMLTSLYQMLHKIMASGIKKGVSVYPEAKRMVAADHRRIVSAIRSGSKTRCFNALTSHLTASERLFGDIFAKMEGGGREATA